MRYFKKEILSNALYLSNGKILRFEAVLDGTTGILQTEDEGLLAELDRALQRHIGGLIEINQGQHEELKKKPAAPRSPKNFSLTPRIINPLPKPASAKAVVVSKPREPSEPLSVPDLKPLVTSLRKARAQKAKPKTLAEETAPPA